VKRYGWLLVLVLVLAGCGGSSSAHGVLSAKYVGSGCVKVKAPAGGRRTAPRPTKGLHQRETYDVVFTTNCGSFTVRLAVRTSPKTTASFASLVRRKYFDGTIFHRIVPGFVIQGGDPTGTGAGGPGYETIDRPPSTTHYTFGLVAMAKTPTAPAGDSGSQFFVVTAKDANLPPEYAVLGRVIAGASVVRLIGTLGDASEHPTRTVEIGKATLHVH
jgi:peptidyl-prolyl cis-trans isomerase B (cyclophilin B)